jgi:hypothetical protein
MTNIIVQIHQLLNESKKYIFPYNCGQREYGLINKKYNLIYLSNLNYNKMN